MNLPKEFTDRMRSILGEEYCAFEASYEETRKYGLRVNTLKITPEEFERIAPFHLTPVSWIPGAYTYLEEDAPARHPFYHAGLYYLQEPSAMTPASVLPIRPGDKVLDLCAAPGGKATALGARLQGKGVLVANDISASRAKALLKNIEVFGIPNAFVTNAVPARLQDHFEGYFDKILVDAPCSGEGMFRKDEATIRAWYPEKPAECAVIQKDIIVRASDMLRDGGMLLYSTCTFAPAENEEVIAHLLQERPDMHLVHIPEREGFAPGLGELTDCVRLWPHKTGGEGHFLALLRKGEEDACESTSCESISYVSNCYGSASCENAYGESVIKEMTDQEKNNDQTDDLESILKSNRKNSLRSDLKINQKKEKNRKAAAGRSRTKAGSEKTAQNNDTQILEEFFGTSFESGGWIEGNPGQKLEVRSGQAYLDTGMLPGVSGITFLRNGLYLGEIKKDRFEPSQSLAMALKADHYPSCIDLQPDDQRLIRYLKGETIDITDEECSSNGWKLITTAGQPLGWGKLVNGLLKNKYHNGWRMK